MTDTIESRGTRWPQPHPRTRWVAGAVVVVCLVAALPVGIYWWTHPDVLPDDTSTAYLQPRPVDRAAVAFPLASPVAARDPAALTWRGASAEFVTNTARATVTYSLCDTALRPGEQPPRFWPVTDLVQICRSQRDLTNGTHLTYPNPDQLVLVTLTPLRPGAVHLAGVEVRYAEGADRLFRHGVDHVALDVHLTVR